MLELNQNSLGNYRIQNDGIISIINLFNLVTIVISTGLDYCALKEEFN